MAVSVQDFFAGLTGLVLESEVAGRFRAMDFEVWEGVIVEF